MATENLMLIMSFDKNLESIKALLQNLKVVYKNQTNITLGIAVYGKNNDFFKAQTKGIKKYCSKKKIPHYLCLNQEPIGNSKKAHIIRGLMDISYFFYKKGYQKVYLLHDDLVIFRNFLPVYEKEMVPSNWSFISTLQQSQDPFRSKDRCFKKFNEIKMEKKSGSSLHTSSIRIRDKIVIFNKLFIQKLYKQFHSKQLNKDEFFSSIHRAADLGFFDLIHNDLVHKKWQFNERILYGNGIGLDDHKGKFFEKFIHMTDYIYNNKNLISAHGRLTATYFRQMLPEILKNTLKDN